MTLMGFIGLLPAIFKFWDQVTWLIQTLQKTPEEQHQALMDKVKAEADAFEQTGRPVWDKNA